MEILMTLNATYVHTNIVAKNWRKLAKFYEAVFGCTPVLPERDLSGQWIDDCTGVSDVRIRGIHLRLPGYADNGPTLEIFQYNQSEQALGPAINRPGLAHIAFAVDDVEVAEKAVLAAGGGRYGQRVSTEIPNVGQITVVYLTDPEGNIIELQCWAK
jgi:predicted enzyme related to lactoylglutathione lyase